MTLRHCWASPRRRGIVDFRAGHYIEPLQAAGCHDVELRRLDWRMRFGVPVNVTGLVTARK